MIVVMRAGATTEDVRQVQALLHQAGLRDRVIEGTDLTVVAAIGDEVKKDPGVFEQLEGVDRVMRVMAPYKLASRESREANTRVAIGEGCVVGGNRVAVIAGPCSVESREQILEAAEGCRAAGAVGLRGGAFKPRTNPYSFQGLGKEGLELLAEARQQTGLPVVTEVLTPAEVELVAEYADCLQIGTRNAQNFKLLEAAGDQPRPVLLKRGMSATLDECLQAAEYILSRGNPNVILCERGIRTFEDHTRNTLSLASVPELKARSHLPVIVDPSQGTGHARLVAPMCQAAIACGADGLIIECHPDPAHALTDGGQSVTPEALRRILETGRRVAEAIGRSM